MEFERIYEDEECLIITKPAGIAVLEAAGKSCGSIAEQLKPYLPVHRLDNETSGALLLAKSEDHYESLRTLFSERKIIKEYKALSYGIVTAPQQIEESIAHHPKKNNRMVITKDGDNYRGHPREANTLIKSASHWYPNSLRPAQFSFLQISITTGVRHQIRVHLASLGHPIVGDKLYGKSDDEDITNRHLLHSARLEFISPCSGDLINVRSKLTKDFSEVCNRLKIVF